MEKNALKKIDNGKTTVAAMITSDLALPIINSVCQHFLENKMTIKENQIPVNKSLMMVVGQAAKIDNKTAINGKNTSTKGELIIKLTSSKKNNYMPLEGNTMAGNQHAKRKFFMLCATANTYDFYHPKCEE